LSLAASFAAASEIATDGARFSLEFLAELGSWVDSEVLRLPDEADGLGPGGFAAGIPVGGGMLDSFKVGVTGRDDIEEVLVAVGIELVAVKVELDTVGLVMPGPGVGMPVDLRAGSLLVLGIELGFFMPEAPGLGFSGSIA